MNALPRAWLIAMTMIVSSPIATVAYAVPDELDYQGYLTNLDGSPVDTTISITFAAYTVDVGGAPVWTQTLAVPVDRGLFSVSLGGAAAPFPAGLFDTPIYIGLFVAGEAMMPRRALKTTAYSFKAGDAETLEGMSAASLDQSSDVAALQGDVSGLQSDVASLDGRVGTIELVDADITSVNTGPGLAGGGTAGDVVVQVAPGGINGPLIAPDSIDATKVVDGSLSGLDIFDNSITQNDIATNGVGADEIAPGAVGSSEIADNSVGAIDIAEDAVGPTELDEAGSYSIAGLTVTGGTTRFQGGGDIRIEDDFNGFRWYDGTGSSQFGAILINSSQTAWQDTGAGSGRYIFYSNATGLGIGTNLPQSGSAVTMPSLNVTGQTEVGLERVGSSYNLSSSATCISYGIQTCYYGSTSVSCPVGKRVLGGGSTGSVARYSQTGQSYPSSTTAWSCSMGYDISGVSRTCYAICARLQ